MRYTHAFEDMKKFIQDYMLRHFNQYLFVYCENAGTDNEALVTTFQAESQIFESLKTQINNIFNQKLLKSKFSGRTYGTELFASPQVYATVEKMPYLLNSYQLKVNLALVNEKIKSQQIIDRLGESIITVSKTALLATRATTSYLKQ